MADFWSRMFRRIQMLPIQLSFTLDMDAEGRHVVHVRKMTDNGVENITDVRPLLRYGYQEESPDGRKIYVVSGADWHILQSVKSLNPEYATDGALVFDVLPPVLSYLRQKTNVNEAPVSQQVAIEAKPLQPAMIVDFDPERGATVKTGYRDGDSAELIAPTQLKVTQDGKWARFGNRFVPLPKALTADYEEMLRRGNWQIQLNDVPEFFLRDLVLYQSKFNAVLTDLAAQVRVVREPLQPVFHVDRDMPGWFSFRVEYQMDGHAVPQSEVTKVGDQHYFRLTPTTWVKMSTKEAREVQKQCEQLGALPTPEGYRLPVHAFASLEEFIKEAGGNVVISTAFQEFLNQLMDFRPDDAFVLSSAGENDLQRSGVTLRHYQRGGIQWLDWLSKNGLHGVLADDMGLGKTLQTIATMRLAYERTLSQQHSLVITPKSVLYHWEREIYRCFPAMPTHVYHGPGRRRDLLFSAKPITFITTYATVANDVETFTKIPLFYLVLDEATHIKNPSAIRTNAVKALNAAHRLALSGTPVENRPSELWSIFDFLMRGHLGRQGTFQSAFEIPIMNGDSTAANRLGRRIKPFMLRRLKEAVAQDLPEKIENEEWCELTEEQRQLYDTMQERAMQLTALLKSGEGVNYTTSILPVLTHMLQVCDHPAIINHIEKPLNGRSEKFDWAVEKIEEILAGNEQVVVFSRFLGMLSLFENALTAQKVRYIRIDGSTDNRQALIDLFNAGQAQVALCSTLAAGHGINLTAANHVIHADRWWNPAVEDQSTDRVHRIGQHRTVHVHRIIVKGTLEERLDKLLGKKRDMAGRIIDAAGGPMGGWTREELIELLRPLD
ncbi:DEAD/DEAH box helicase [Candidatus Amarolinea aalborgensis]|uniref:DEAD/DEAH box helicase n=1 Tax=Candidatus Amarolinea aalborgensis TaxID=2249329 RepID=UPI003BF99E9A